MYSFWPKQTDSNPFTEVLNQTQKYVASNTLDEPLPWMNSSLVSGDAAVTVAALKEEEGKDIAVLGSGELVQTLMEHRLVDEYTLLIHPLVLGSGRRLFREGSRYAPAAAVEFRHHDNRRGHRDLHAKRNRAEHMSAIAGLFVALTLAGTMLAPADIERPPSEEPRQPAIWVLTPPSPVLATDGRRHLVYEILVENTTSSPLRLDRVEVVAPGSGVVAVYRGRELEKFLVGFGPPRRTLATGRLGGVFLDVTFAPRDRIPSRLEHRLVFGRARPLTVAGAETTIDHRAPSRVSPPLQGDDLLVLGCCGRNVGHRFALLEVDGSLYLAQRFAIDFLRVDEQLNFYSGDPAKNESYFAYGDEIRAAAPGVVVAARDGVPDNTPPDIPPEAMTIEGASGNFVTVDHGDGRFAMYAHLQPGSQRVGIGDRVRRGQILGLVGNSGNSDFAHLHFHITDGPSNLGANGVPYVFDRFRLDARVEGLESEPPSPVLVPADPPRLRNQPAPTDRRCDLVRVASRVPPGGTDDHTFQPAGPYRCSDRIRVAQALGERRADAVGRTPGVGGDRAGHLVHPGGRGQRLGEVSRGCC